MRRMIPCSIQLMIIGALLLMCSLWLTGEGSGETISVDDDGGADYTKIQDAIDNATNGDTIRVYDGVYNNSIVINITINIIGNGSSNTTIRDWRSNIIIHVLEPWVNISGFNISGTKHWSTGILVDSNHTSISQNFIKSHTGLLLNYSRDNSIINNTFDDCLAAAIRSIKSNYNIIRQNLIINSGDGIKFEWDCDNNIIENNTLKSNGRGIEISAGGGETSDHNTINENIVIDGYYGIQASFSNFLEITGNYISDAEEGIYIGHSEIVIISNNEVSSAERHGIAIRWSENVTATNNTCQDSENGILLSGGSNNQITSNIVHNNSNAGIFISTSVNNEIMYNWKSSIDRAPFHLANEGSIDRAPFCL